MIADGDLDGRYWELPVCDEVRNLGLQVTPEGDVYGT